MHKAHGGLQDIHKDRNLKILLIFASMEHLLLACFYVPVAEIIPEEGIDGLGCIIEVILLHSLFNGKGCIVKTGIDPSVSQAKLCLVDLDHVPSLKIHQKESGCIPDLVGEPGAQTEGFHIDLHILSLGCKEAESELHGVCTILVYDIQWVYTISKGFRHLSSLSVNYPTMRTNGFVRSLLTPCNRCKK